MTERLRPIPREETGNIVRVEHVNVPRNSTNRGDSSRPHPDADASDSPRQGEQSRAPEARGLTSDPPRQDEPSQAPEARGIGSNPPRVGTVQSGAPEARGVGSNPPRPAIDRPHRSEPPRPAERARVSEPPRPGSDRPGPFEQLAMQVVAQQTGQSAADKTSTDKAPEPRARASTVVWGSGDLPGGPKPDPARPLSPALAPAPTPRNVSESAPAVAVSALVHVSGHAQVTPRAENPNFPAQPAESAYTGAGYQATYAASSRLVTGAHPVYSPPSAGYPAAASSGSAYLPSTGQASSYPGSSQAGAAQSGAAQQSAYPAAAQSVSGYAGAGHASAYPTSAQASVYPAAQTGSAFPSPGQTGSMFPSPGGSVFPGSAQVSGYPGGAHPLTAHPIPNASGYPPAQLGSAYPAAAHPTGYPAAHVSPPGSAYPAAPGGSLFSPTGRTSPGFPATSQGGSAYPAAAQPSSAYPSAMPPGQSQGAASRQASTHIALAPPVHGTTTALQGAAAHDGVEGAPAGSLVTARSAGVASYADRLDWQRLWLALQRTEWQSLGFVDPDPKASTLPLAQALADVGHRHHGQTLSVMDVRDLSLDRLEARRAELLLRVRRNEIVLLALGSVLDNPPLLSLAESIDVMVLAAARGSFLKEAERTVEALGAQRFVGSLLYKRGNIR